MKKATKKLTQKTAVTTFLSLFVLLGLTITQSCSSDDDGGQEPEPEEFIAEDEDFDDYMNWVLEATNEGVDPSFANSEAHGMNNEDAIREIYFKDNQDPVNGIYPVGTLIVKHSYNPEHQDEFNEFTAMAKRGGDYNEDGGGWEYFMLDEEGNIAGRGANLMDGMCASCHAGAQNKDYVYTK